MVARRQPPIINHTMIHSIVPLANSSPRLISVLREKEDPGEKARAFSREITSAAGRELASSSRGGNLSLLEPTIQHPSPTQPQRPTHASTRDSEHHPPSLSSFFWLLRPLDTSTISLPLPLLTRETLYFYGFFLLRAFGLQQLILGSDFGTNVFDQLPEDIRKDQVLFLVAILVVRKL